jgi:ribosomal protein S18 acetylase RimI-like enzyme
VTKQEIIKYIDDGAIFYLNFFGDAEHMKSTNNSVYREICPKDGEHGIRFIYDLRLEHLSDDEAQVKIAELKSLSLPVWWPLYSEKVQRLLHGKDYVPQPPVEGDEFYMALFPDNQPDIISTGAEITRVKTAAEFKIWANMANQIFANGYQDIHPINHYHWCEKNLLFPYIAYKEDKPAAVSAILNNNGIASLEFVATLPEYRRKGLARAASIAAVSDAFTNGARIITLRAFYPANLLYQSLGFQIYY